MIRRVEQEDGSIYIAGESVFTDVLLIVALLLAFIIVFLLGYCSGSRCGRRAVNNATKAVICDGGCQVTAAGEKRVTANGGKQDESLPTATSGDEQFTDEDEADKQQSADDDAKKRSTDVVVKPRSADDDDDSTI